MNLNLIVAHSKNRVIGNNNKLPWDIPKDMEWFKSKTKGKCVIMGRKTAQSIGRALPNRHNIVLSKNPTYVPSVGFHVASDLDEALFQARYLDNSIYPEIFFIGGEYIYKQVASKVKRMYITEIDKEYGGDSHFPELNMNLFREVSRVNNTENGINFDFVIYERK